MIITTETKEQIIQTMKEMGADVIYEQILDCGAGYLDDILCAEIDGEKMSVHMDKYGNNAVSASNPIWGNSYKLKFGELYVPSNNGFVAELLYRKS